MDTKTTFLEVNHSDCVLLLMLLIAERGRILAKPMISEEEREATIKYAEQINAMRKRVQHHRLMLIARMNEADAERASALVL